MSNQTPSRERKPRIDCPMYVPLAGSRRCQYYLDGGACELDTEFMCVEWLKANRRSVPEMHPGRTASLMQPGLFPIPAPERQQHPCATRAPSAPRAPTAPASHVPRANAPWAVQEVPRAPTAPEDHVPRANAPWAVQEVPRAPTAPESEATPTPVPAGPRPSITPEEIASFQALGVELCLDLEEVGPVWLVPRYTGQPRREITPEHAATLRLLLDAFPGARIGAFERRMSGGGEEHAL